VSHENFYLTYMTPHGSRTPTTVLIDEPTDVEELCKALQEACLIPKGLHIAMSKHNDNCVPSSSL